MLDMIAERHPNIDATQMTEGWWRSNIVDCYSKLLVFCRECKCCCDTTQITSIQQGSGFGCLCRNKTEAKLHRWLSRCFSDVQCQAGECYNEATQRRLPFDFALCLAGRVVYVELDGDIGHFGVGFHGEETCAVAERDLKKERWAIAQGRSVVRVLQVDVWADAGGWQAYLQEALQSAALSPVVIHPSAPQYCSGIYAELRAC